MTDNKPRRLRVLVAKGGAGMVMVMVMVKQAAVSIVIVCNSVASRSTVTAQLCPAVIASQRLWAPSVRSTGSQPRHCHDPCKGRERVDVKVLSPSPSTTSTHNTVYTQLLRMPWIAGQTKIRCKLGIQRIRTVIGASGREGGRRRLHSPQRGRHPRLTLVMQRRLNREERGTGETVTQRGRIPPRGRQDRDGKDTHREPHPPGHAQ